MPEGGRQIPLSLSAFLKMAKNGKRKSVCDFFQNGGSHRISWISEESVIEQVPTIRAGRSRKKRGGMAEMPPYLVLQVQREAGSPRRERKISRKCFR